MSLGYWLSHSKEVDHSLPIVGRASRRSVVMFLPNSSAPSLQAACVEGSHWSAFERTDSHKSVQGDTSVGITKCVPESFFGHRRILDIRDDGTWDIWDLGISTLTVGEEEMLVGVEYSDGSRFDEGLPCLLVKRV